jgi:ATP-dependent DNA helicase RecG
MMAPTSILAAQHYANLKPMAEEAGVVIEILTGADKGAERAAKLRALAAGDIQLLVGTHAVFQDEVAFADLRLAIVDEQHRFGVAERVRLSAKGQATDVLVMTATPIPRTLSLAQYGDMDISVLDEKPPGRQPVKTALLSTARIGEVVSHLRDAIWRRGGRPTGSARWSRNRRSMTPSRRRNGLPICAPSWARGRWGWSMAA